MKLVWINKKSIDNFLKITDPDNKPNAMSLQVVRKITSLMEEVDSMREMYGYLRKVLKVLGYQGSFFKKLEDGVKGLSFVYNQSKSLRSLVLHQSIPSTWENSFNSYFINTSRCVCNLRSSLYHTYVRSTELGQYCNILGLTINDLNNELAHPVVSPEAYARKVLEVLSLQGSSPAAEPVHQSDKGDMLAELASARGALLSNKEQELCREVQVFQTIKGVLKEEYVSRIRHRVSWHRRRGVTEDLYVLYSLRIRSGKYAFIKSSSEFTSNIEYAKIFTKREIANLDTYGLVVKPILIGE